MSQPNRDGENGAGVHFSLKGNIMGEEAMSLNLFPKLPFGPGSVGKDSCCYFVKD